MSKRERDRVRQVLYAPNVHLWIRYKARVEEIRVDLIREGKTFSEATAAWDLALAENPYSDAMLGRAPDGGTAPDVPATPAKETQPDSDIGCTDGPNLEQTPRADMLWVGANFRVVGVTRADAPNQTSWNLLQWATKDEVNENTFWARHMSIAASRDGEKQDRMKDDGQPALRTVEALLEKDYGGAVAA